MSLTFIDLAGGADPHLVAVLLIASFIFLLFELLHPGLFLPGAIGAAGFFATSAVLLRANLAKNGAESALETASGSLNPAYLLALGLIVIGFFILIAGFLSYRTRRRDAADLETQLLGQIGKVVRVHGDDHLRGMVNVCGENWKFVSDRPVQAGSEVEVVAQKKLELRVESREKQSLL